MSKREHTERLRAAARLAEEARIVVAGAKKDGGGQRAPVEAADSLRSSQTAQVLDLLSEGEIGGLVNGDRSIYLDGVPLKAEDGSYNFQDVVTAWTHGTQGQAALPELSGVQNEVGVGVAVPFATPAVRSIANLNVDTVRVTINVPQISSTDTSNGDINGSSFTWAVDVQANGGGYVEVFQDTVSGKKMSSYKRARKFPLTGTGPWNVRVRRVSGDSGSANVVNAFLWESYTEIQSLKLRYPNSALVMLAVNAQHFNRIPTRAYDILGIRVRVPSNYNPLTRAYTGIWDGTFQVAWTNNPAWIFLELISNERWGLGGWLAQAGLNAESAKWQLYTISQYCDGMVSDGYGGMEPRFTCNAYIQTREQALQVVQHFAAIFRGAAFWAAGELHITQDAPSEPVALFTPANVVDGRFSYQTGSDKQRHSVFIVYWNDLTQLGRRTPEVWAPDHLVARFGLKELPVEPIGITRRGQALRLAKWMAYTEEHEGRVVAFKVGSQGALVLPGQVFQVADPSEAGERLGGRIHAATASQVTLDAPVTLLPGEVYTLTVQLPDPGDQAKLVTEERAVTNAAGPTSVLNLAAPYSQAPAPQAVWILQSNNIAATTWRCLSCRESDDGTEYEITALAHDPAKFAAVEQGIVLEPRPVTRLPTRVKKPLSVTLTPQLYQDGQTWRIKLLVSWVPSAAGLQHIVSWRRELGPWVTLAQTVDQSVEIPGLDPGALQVEVRAVNALGNVSVPASAATSVQGNTVPAANVTGLVYSIDTLGALITWAGSIDFDWSETELRLGSVWDTATLLARGRVNSYRLGWPPNGTYPVLARHRRRSGPDGAIAAINVVVTDKQLLADALTNLIGPEQLENGAVNASKLAAGSVDAGKLALEIGGGNLLSNSSFEVDTNADGLADSWIAYSDGSPGTVTYDRPSTVVRYGAAAQRATASALAAGQGNRAGFSQLVAGAYAARKMVFSAWVVATAGIDITLRIDWRDSSGATISSNSVTTVGDATMARSQVAATAPALTAEAKLYIWISDGTGVGAVLRADGAQFEFGDVATGYAPRPDELLPGAVASTAIADGAVTAIKTSIAAINAATGALNAGTVDAAQILTNAVTALKLAAGAVTAAKTAIAAIDSSSGNLTANSVTATQLAAGAVVAGKIAADAVTANEIAANSVGVNELAAGAVTTGKLAAGAVTTPVLAAGAVTANELAADAVTANKILAGAVVAGKIAAGAVGATEVAANAITTDKLLVTGRGRALNDDPACSDSSAWSRPIGSAMVIVGSGAPVGTTALRATNGTQIISRSFPVEAGKFYKVSLWARQVSGGGTLYVRMYCYNASGTLVNYAVSGITPTTGNMESLAVPASWTRYSGYCIPGGGAVYAQVFLHVNWNTTGVTDVTDVRGEEYVGGDLIVDGSIVASKINTNGLEIRDVNGNVILAAGTPNGLSRVRGTGAVNILDPSTWAVGSTGSQPGFNANGLPGESAIVMDTAPDGAIRPMWRSTSSDIVGTSADGGWNTAAFAIDPAKMYRFHCWIRQSTNLAGNWYLGVGNDVRVISTGADIDNAYFISGSEDALVAGRWYLLVGYVLPHSYGTAQLAMGGLYDGVTGRKVFSSTDYKWRSTASSTFHRCYLFYGDVGAVQDFWGPGVYLCDGNEPTLDQLLAVAAIGAADLATSAPVALVASTGMEILGGTATKIAGSTSDWDNAVRSVEGYTGGVFVSARVDRADRDVMLGLNTDPGLDDSYSSIDYAWYMVSNGTTLIFESGSNVGGFGAYAAGDVFSVTYDGTAIRYWRNGTLARTVTVTISGALYLDTSFVQIGGKLSNIRFGPYGNPSAVQGSNPITSANASTYLAVAAIGDAFIANLNAAKINAGFLSADRVALNSLNADRITAGTINTDRLIIGSVSANVVAQGSSVSLGTPATSSPFNAGPVTLIGITKQQGYILFSGQLEFQFILGTGFTGVALHMGVSFDITPDPAGDTLISPRFDRVPVFTEPAGPFKMARLSVPISHVIPTSAANGTYSLRASFQATGRDAAGGTVVFGSSPFLNASYSYEVNAVEVKV